MCTASTPMKQLLQIIIRHSGTLAFGFFLFAAVSGIYVVEGLWQGSGLHGYTFQIGRRGVSSYLASTWTAFLQMLVCTTLGAMFTYIALRRAGGVRAIFGLGRMRTKQSDNEVEQQKKGAHQTRRKLTKRR